MIAVVLWCAAGYVALAALGALALGRMVKLADARDGDWWAQP